MLPIDVALALPKLTVNLTGCGARMGRINFLRSEGYSDPLDYKVGCAARQGLDYLPLKPNQTTCVFEAKAGARINLRTSHYSYQASDRNWGVVFESFSGQCQGEGNFIFNGGIHECVFVMPASGTFVNVRFETGFGSPGALPGPLCVSAPLDDPTPPSDTALDGAAYAGAIGDAAASVIQAAGLGGLLRGVAVLSNPPVSASNGAVRFTLSPVAAAGAPKREEASWLQPVAFATTTPTALMRISAVVNANTPTAINLTLTKPGRKFVKGRKALKVRLNVAFTERGTGQEFKSTSIAFTVRR